MFWKSTYNEFIKIAAKPRSYIGIGAITVIVAIILFALHAEGMSMISWLTQPFEQALSFEGNILNGNLIAFIILQMLIIHVPLLVALVTGDLVSGESAMGTIRLLLTKPISRTQILFSKYLAGCAYTFVMLMWLAFLALVVGKWIFGSGDLIVLNSDGLIIFQEHELGWRFLCGLGTAYLSLVMIATLSLTFSCFSENSIGPIVSTMAVIIVFTIIGAIESPALQVIQPYLFTNHMAVWRNFFEDPLPVGKILHSAGILLAHIVVLLSIAVYKFNRKDILS
ncbi:MAG: ABC transporter permease [Bacteroidia bacterium]